MEVQEVTRGSGILLAVSSLPSPYGIGTLGDAARQFVDLLVDLKQKYWQILPLGPTSYGDSPYQSFSTFAGSFVSTSPSKFVILIRCVSATTAGLP